MAKMSDKELYEAIRGADLTSLTVGNFKAFGPKQTVRLAPLTLVYGPNSGGKSSLLHAIALLSQSAKEGHGQGLLATDGPLVEFGGIRSFWADHDSSKPLTLGFGCRAGEAEFQFGARFTEERDARWVSAARVRFPDGRGLSLVPMEGGGPGKLRLADAQASEDWRSLLAERSNKERTPSSNFFNAPENRQLLVDQLAHKVTFEFVRLFSMRVTMDGAFTQINWPRANEEARHAEKWVHQEWPTNDLFEDISSLIEWTAYLGPLRYHHPRAYVASRYRASSIGRSGESMAQVLLGDQKLSERANEWLRRLGIPYSLAVKVFQDDVAGALSALRLYADRPGRSSPLALSPADVGFGISQVLPIIVRGYVDDTHIVCVEQPEIHLHPRLQADLADFFIETAGIGKPWTEDREFPRQWILETHSEALIQRVLTRIRQGAVSPRDVCVLYVDDGVTRRRGTASAEAAPVWPPWPGGSVVMELRIDDQGEFLDPWPAGFFVENVEEMLS